MKASALDISRDIQAAAWNRHSLVRASTCQAYAQHMHGMCLVFAKQRPGNDRSYGLWWGGQAVADAGVDGRAERDGERFECEMWKMEKTPAITN